MMETIANKINVSLTPNSRISELEEGLNNFGRVFSDHMFVVDYADGKWGTASIQPYKNLSLSPATSAIHYGQSIFEGMKAYKNKAGKTLIFRPTDNIKRLNISAERMCMPAIPEDLFYDGLTQLLETDKAWIPPHEGTSLYIRPFMFSTDNYIGVKPSDTYKFMIFTTPVGGYYSEPVKVKVETHYTRSASGGVGFAKAAGNYAASLYPAKLAQKEGYHQLVWTDAKEHKYIEESGTMNIMFVIGDKLITPSTSDSILDGITRDSVLTLARDWGYTVEERKVSIDEVVEAAATGNLKEAFGTGTAATIAQIAVFNHNGIDYELPAIETREFSNRVGQYLQDIKRGKIQDNHGWIVEL
ncbi:MAG: branched-chain amino acid aminotransferase [Flavobacteriales bacterium]|nr:branched-chain amino acid aminotransferase [Flavobacteriales bacterium]